MAKGVRWKILRHPTLVIDCGPIVDRSEYPMQVVCIKLTEDSANKEIDRLRNTSHWNWSFSLLREEFEIETGHLSIKE